MHGGIRFGHGEAKLLPVDGRLIRASASTSGVSFNRPQLWSAVRFSTVIAHPRKLKAKRWRAIEAAAKSANALLVSSVRRVQGRRGTGTR